MSDKITERLANEEALRGLVEKGLVVAFLDRQRRLRYTVPGEATPAQCARSLRGDALKLAQQLERHADAAPTN